MNDIENLRKIPSSMESEKAVLGGVFLKPEVFSDVVEILRPEYFYRNAYKTIFESMLELYGKSEVIDPILIMESLKKKWKI